MSSCASKYGGSAERIDGLRLGRIAAGGEQKSVCSVVEDPVGRQGKCLPVAWPAKVAGVEKSAALRRQLEQH